MAKLGDLAANLTIPLVRCFKRSSSPGRHCGAKLPHQGDPLPKGRVQARSVLQRGGGAAVNSRSSLPAQAPVCPAPASGGCPGRESVSSHGRQSAPVGHPGPGSPAGEHPLSSAPARSPIQRGPRTRAPPLRGESHRGRTPRALPPDWGPRPSSTCTPAHGLHSQAAARSGDAVLRSRAPGRWLPAPLRCYTGVPAPASVESRRSPRGPPRCCVYAAPTSARPVCRPVRGTDRVPPHFPRRASAGPASAGPDSSELPPGRGEKPPYQYAHQGPG
ncbi:hypothetical protein NDU88_001686 [Pleurodeles waltl]|uniref:Uncharacterized protein n=1 Tax=Pleurodeles waltl TaxID=8319 RepID=A0AAV7LDB7_PLEWA|nr:hypothetical protein NDU88_001686 [Pleurodeles waltl]